VADRGYNDANNGDSRSITMSIGQPEGADGAVHCGVYGDYVYIGGITRLLVFSGVAGQAVTPSQFTIYKEFGMPDYDGLLDDVAVRSHDAAGECPNTCE
jgi:hypothetical protein